jgi:hypothetical protein
MFLGIIIRMYCDKAEHNPPHFHAYYNEFKAIVDIRKCEIIQGNLPKKQGKLVLAWAEFIKKSSLLIGSCQQMANCPLK